MRAIVGKKHAEKEVLAERVAMAEKEAASRFELSAKASKGVLDALFEALANPLTTKAPASLFGEWGGCVHAVSVGVPCQTKFLTSMPNVPWAARDRCWC
jgi:hypothetical protein